MLESPKHSNTSSTGDATLLCEIVLSAYCYGHGNMVQVLFMHHIQRISVTRCTVTFHVRKRFLLFSFPMDPFRCFMSSSSCPEKICPRQLRKSLEHHSREGIDFWTPADGSRHADWISSFPSTTSPRSPWPMHTQQNTLYLCSLRW